ncbi:saccharopine dehydrogenase [Jimgerdemannia flammicorona]|uniref:Saccharopine dehydrogenase n=2 Tax=Jimgerdemannia flammicorona TaxID=994334 RepID=A0A433CYC2_9FUNG|nr:saccharopine dehydrogenase [Jimgerdemannia flammicorona]RUS23496.1 saccharopine dehydrogenase [Jimgerdemannia flammicorona]
MSTPQRDLTLTVFGATGFTGQYIVEEVYRTFSGSGVYDNPPHVPADFSWAIAGRSQDKLQELLDRVETKYNVSGKLKRPEILIADITKRDALNAMCARSHVIINAVGPFRFMGEYVVRACVENGANYVDITGEPEFIERMQRTYHDEAKKHGVTIVHACGFDSVSFLLIASITSIRMFAHVTDVACMFTQVPTDMAVLWNKQQIQTRSNATPVQMEMFFTIKPGPYGIRGHYATYESAVHGISSASTLRALRDYSTLPRLPTVPGPKLVLHKGSHWNARIGGYTSPFIFADPSVVRLSQQLFLAGQAAVPDNANAVMPPTVQFAAYFVFPSLWPMVLYMTYGFVFSLFTSTPWGRNLLLRNPERFSGGLFSHDGPTREQIETTRFESTFITRGFTTEALREGKEPDVEMVTRVEGPEAAYDATPRIIVQCAYALVDEKGEGRVPDGVVTSSVAFWRTGLVERLQAVGINFEVMQG